MTLLANPPYILSRWGAIFVAFGISSLITFLAGKAYARKKRPFRFGILGMTIMLGVLWGAVFFISFDRLYLGY